MAGVLVVLSIALITIYFRESAGGGLHQVQSAGATVLRPFEVAAERVARPFRDAYGYFAGLIHAKSQNGRLRDEVDLLRQQVTQNATAASENAELKRLLHFTAGPSFPGDLRPVTTRIIAQPSPALSQVVSIDAGKTSGIRKDDPVITAEGLIGSVSKVTRDTAQVTLLTDETSAATARDANTGAVGVVKQGAVGFELDGVDKEQKVEPGDRLVTAGWRERNGLSSIFPPNIPIGKVTSVGQTEVDSFKRVQLEPYADFGSLSIVVVMIPKNRR